MADKSDMSHFLILLGSKLTLRLSCSDSAAHGWFLRLGYARMVCSDPVSFDYLKNRAEPIFRSGHASQPPVNFPPVNFRRNVSHPVNIRSKEYSTMDSTKM